MVERQVVTSLYPATLVPYKYNFSFTYEHGFKIRIAGYEMNDIKFVDHDFFKFILHFIIIIL